MRPNSAVSRPAWSRVVLLVLQLVVVSALLGGVLAALTATPVVISRLV